jgi:hypothetical protein
MTGTNNEPINSNYIIEPTHNFFDLNMVNNDTTGNGEAKNLSFNETRNNPLINNAEDYYLSVVRFNVDTPTLPLFIPQVQLNQNDPNVLVYSITLKWAPTGVESDLTKIIFESQNPFEPAPSPPSQKQDLKSEYYYVNNFQHFIKMVNKGFTDALASLKINEPLVPAGVNDPFLEINPTTGNVILNGEEGFFDEANPNKIEIYFNGALFTLFSSLEGKSQKGGDMSNGKNHLMTIRNINKGNIYNVNGINYLQSYGEYPTTPLWNPVSAIVFSASLVPIVPEQVSQSIVFNSEIDPSSLGGNNAEISNTLTDLIIPLKSGTETKPTVSYAPTAEYRLIDLMGHNPIKGIQVQCFWKDKYGGLHPFKLASGCSASMKILFRKKTF